MGILGFLGGLIKPATELVDNLHTSEEEKLTLKAQLMKIENEFAGKLLEYHTKLLDAQSTIIEAEAKSESWLARTWRPIFALTLVAFWALGKSGVSEPITSDEVGLMKICLGGYIFARSGEKVVKDTPNVVDAVKRAIKS